MAVSRTCKPTHESSSLTPSHNVLLKTSAKLLDKNNVLIVGDELQVYFATVSVITQYLHKTHKHILQTYFNQNMQDNIM